MNPPRASTHASAKRTLAISGVMLVIFLFAIDATIVSTSMPTIVARLGGLELYSWVFSIYMLTSALTTPLFGKLADLFSHRRLMLIGIGIFVLGSTLCGAAQSMEMLVLFRAIQGLGGGAIYALSFIVVGVLFPPEQRAKMQGIISSVWGISSILGPLAGGLIVEHTSWRWVFFVNLPITAVSIGLIIVGLKEEKVERHAPKLDLLGGAALLLSLLLMFYALAHSAHDRQPFNTELLLLLALSFMILVVFYFIERRAEEPIIPLDLFVLKLYRSSTMVSTLAAMGVFGAISYLPLYLQGVLGMSASGAGMILLLLSMGWTAGSLIAGHSIDRLGYRSVAAAGMACMAVGFGIFVMTGEPLALYLVLLASLLIGVGMGMANLTTLVSAQSAVPIRRIGVATSTLMLFRTFGGAFCISLMGTVLLNHMQHGLEKIGGGLSATLRDKIANPQNLLEPVTRELIPQEILPKLIELLADSLWFAFSTAFALMILGCVVSAGMGAYTPANTPRPDGKATQ